MDKLKSRREFLQFISNQTALIGLSPFLISSLSSCSSTPDPLPFEGLKKSIQDGLQLVSGLNYHIICASGDTINRAGDFFGDCNDFTCFLPLQGKSNEGLLWVNHEYTIPEFLHKKNTNKLSRSINEIVKEQEMVGGSILHIKKQDNHWQLQKFSKYNRRLHGRTQIPFSHGHSIQGSRSAVGTIANCSGGLTPWNTFLSSEENYDGFYGEATLLKGKRTVNTFKKFNWYKHFPLPPEHYGWIVEIDPFTGKAEKQTLLGRAPHEGATVVTTRDNLAVVYMGEDREGGYIYKFISQGPNLRAGTLYAADTINGKWLPLDIKLSPVLKNNFKSQIEVLTYAHQSAEIVGATPQDRPEDIEVNKRTGDIFIALTKSPKNNNLFGSLLKISESKDYNSTSFKSSTWISGGLSSGMACPDNLCFDNKGNLWVTTDMSEKDIGKEAYKMFGNNGLFYIPLTGKAAGIPILVASAPNDAEFTGPWFSPDYKTLFLSVQHPGSLARKDIKHPTSHWPDGQSKLPRSAVIAIQGDLFNRLF